MIVGHTRGSSFRARQLDEHSRSSWLGRIDPRAKLIGVLCFIAVAALLTKPDLVIAALACSIIFASISKIPLRHIARAYAATLPFILLASVSVFLFTGWENGATMLARTSSCTLPLIVLVSGTETFELFSGLRRLHVPALLTSLLMLAHRYVFLLSDELSRMTVARKARGFSGGKSLLDRYGLRVISNTAGMVLVRASDRADRVFEGLRSRGFDTEMYVWRESRFGRSGVSFVVCFAAASAFLISFQLGVIG